MKYPVRLPLSSDRLADALDYAKDFALAHSLCMRAPSRKQSSDTAVLVPLTLLPTPFPRPLFQQALQVQQDMNALYFACSMDVDFINASLTSVAAADDFTARQLRIFNTVMQEGVRQNLVVQIQRSDYMCHAPDNDNQSARLKQIEVNNIAASFGGLSTKCTRLHRRLLQHLGVERSSVEQQSPLNDSLQCVAGGLALAWREFSSQFTDVSRPAVLHVVEDLNANICDQRLVEFEVDRLTEGAAPTLRLTLTQCHNRLTLSEGGHLVDGPTATTIGVVYYRAGYVPQHYASDKEWDARLLIERSTAVKSPWIGLQLVNTKKIQQVLSARPLVSKYLALALPGVPNLPDRVGAVCDTFAGLWPLTADSGDTAALIERCRQQPAAFVLKPQLEGGGSNIYGANIAATLDRMTPAEREAYILMERITPLQAQNYLIPSGAIDQPPELATVVSELGVYGWLAGRLDSRQVQHNINAGHLLRTKALGVDEGGIMSGSSAIDSPWLTD